MSGAAEKEQQPAPRRQPSAQALHKLNQQRKELIAGTTLEQRRAFIASLHAGVSQEEARLRAGLTLEQGVEIKRRNTRERVRYYLGPLEEVK